VKITPTSQGGGDIWGWLIGDERSKDAEQVLSGPGHPEVGVPESGWEFLTRLRWARPLRGFPAGVGRRRCSGTPPLHPGPAPGWLNEPVPGWYLSAGEGGARGYSGNGLPMPSHRSRIPPYYSHVPAALVSVRPGGAPAVTVSPGFADRAGVFYGAWEARAGRCSADSRRRGQRTSSLRTSRALGVEAGIEDGYRRNGVLRVINGLQPRDPVRRGTDRSQVGMKKNPPPGRRRRKSERAAGKIRKKPSWERQMPRGGFAYRDAG